VVTDMTMPHMTGDKFAMELKQIREDVRIILCTGYSNKISAEIAKEIGIDGFTYKPFSKTELANTVREVLTKA
jgi:CheY-like chemotaxis protein